MKFLRLLKSENGEPEINIIGEKHQYKDKFILNNAPSDTKQNQITDSIKEIYPTVMGQLDYNNWINCNLLHILEDNNITETHQKGVEECSGLLLKKQVSLSPAIR